MLDLGYIYLSLNYSTSVFFTEEHESVQEGMEEWGVITGKNSQVWLQKKKDTQHSVYWF